MKDVVEERVFYIWNDARYESNPQFGFEAPMAERRGREVAGQDHLA